MTKDSIEVVKQSKDNFTWCVKPLRVGIHDFILYNNRLFVELQIDTGRGKIEYRWIDVISTTNQETKINDFLHKSLDGKSIQLETPKEIEKVKQNIKHSNPNHNKTDSQEKSMK